MKLLSLLISLSIFVNCEMPNQNTMQEHLLQEGYIGKVVIDFNNEEGINARDSEGNYRYLIPNTGRLEVKESMPMGFVNPDNTKFYYSSELGDLTEIVFQNHSQDEDQIAMRGPYPVNGQLIYFIDQRSELDKYPNPAISKEGRN